MFTDDRPPPRRHMIAQKEAALGAGSSTGVLISSTTILPAIQDDLAQPQLEG